MRMNRLHNIKNHYQGSTKKVLCVCSAGLLRSPTAAHVLAGEPYNLNTRAVGHNREYALQILDDVVLEWADEVVCMTKDQLRVVEDMLDAGHEKTVICLDIDDDFAYRDPVLVAKIKKNYDEAMNVITAAKAAKEI